MTVQPYEAPRSAYLDGVHGLASFMVAASHCLASYQPAMLKGDQGAGGFAMPRCRLAWCCWPSLYGWVASLSHRKAKLAIAPSSCLYVFGWCLWRTLCRFLGRIFFILYLVQVPVFGAVEVPIFLPAAPHWDYERWVALAFGACLVACIILAELAARFIDEFLHPSFPPDYEAGLGVARDAGTAQLWLVAFGSGRRIRRPFGAR